MSLNILYVEDEITTSNLTSEMIKIYCNKLYVAYNGEDGNKIFHEKKPNLIITDINMPIMNGLDMIRNIRKVNSDVHIYVTTAYDSNYEYKNILQKLNVIGVISKPIDFEVLETILQFHKEKHLSY